MTYNIAVSGNQWITEYLILALLENGIIPSLVINMGVQHEVDISGYRNLEIICKKNKITLYRPTAYSLKSNEDIDVLSCMNIDVLLVFGWQRLIPEWLINKCRLGVYGVHGGPEKPPRCRGRAVFNWAIIMNYRRFYMYLFRLTPEIDSGDIIELCEFEINEFDDIVSIYNKNCVVSTRMIMNNINNILIGNINTVKQLDGEITYLPKRKHEDGEIYWDKSSTEICNLIRALNKPYPGAFTTLDGIRIYIYRANVFDTKINFKAVPGKIVDVFSNGDFIVCTNEYPVYVREYYSESDITIIKGNVFTFKHNYPTFWPVI